MCSKFPFLKIDTDHIIFENCRDEKHAELSKSYFCQLPGTLSISRIKRAMVEYPKFFINEIYIIISWYIKIWSFFES